MSDPEVRLVTAMLAGDELALVDRKLTRYEQIENAVSAGVGLVLALAYFFWWYAYGYIRWYSALIPFFVGGAISKLVFAYVETKLEERRKALAEAPPPPPMLPEARVIAERKSEREAPELAPLEPAATVAPEPAPPPPAPGEEPRLLK